MKPLLLLAIGIAAAAPAAKPDTPAPLLGIADLDPARVLPPPPVAGSAQALAELAELRAIERSRTPAETAAARAEGETKDASIFASAIPGFDLAHLPATTRLMAMVRASEKTIVAHGKDEFKRPRPWVIDPNLATCKRSEGEPLSSYPSGHTSMAFAMGETLAWLVPTRAPAILARAAAYGQSRIVCEQHFRSDLTAGQTLGTLVAERLRANPAFAAAAAEAKKELAPLG